jgi:hypothetical protein
MDQNILRERLKSEEGRKVPEVKELSLTGEVLQISER